MSSTKPDNFTTRALFAGGCFWGVQHYFDQVPGIIRTEAGYTGGRTKNPTYKDVCSKNTGHAEAVLIELDPNTVSYGTLLGHFFRMHDPTQLNRQGPDIGDQYRSAIFYFNGGQMRAAHQAREKAQASFDQPIATKIEPVGEFYTAESYHQKYAERTGRGQCHIPYRTI